MISDYSNPYFYQTPSSIKAHSPFVGYPYPVDGYNFKHNQHSYPGQVFDYPLSSYYSISSTCLPNPPNSADQYRGEFVDQPLVKYEYQEPEENFISIDELQYKPDLLKMILPHDAEPDALKQRVTPDGLKKAKFENSCDPEIPNKEEPENVSSPEGSDIEKKKLKSKAITPPTSLPVSSTISIKVEDDDSNDNDTVVVIPSPVAVKSEFCDGITIISDSDEEIDENEVGVEFNWIDLEEKEKQEYECRFCGKNVSSSYNLRRHMMIHTDNRPFGCDICLKCFREFSDLKKHRRCHRGDHRYKCMICRENPLGDKDGIKCFSCSQKKISPYGNVYLEELPVLEAMGDKKSFLCPDCGRVFGSRHNLRRHYMIHTGAKPYPCDVCDKTFREVSTLKKHMLTHSRMKLFKCSICNREYNDYQAFVRHKNLHGDDWKNTKRNSVLENGKDGNDHENEEEYLFECNDCRKRFTDVTLYKKHLRLHSHYFTFQCYICKMTFKKCEKLNSHMVTHSHELSDSD